MKSNRLRDFLPAGFLFCVGLIGGFLCGFVGNVRGQCTQPGLFAGAVHYGAGVNPSSIVLVDFNEDGILDVATSNQDLFVSGGDASSISVLIGRGSGGVGDGTFNPDVLYPSGDSPLGMVSEDFNSDGIADLAVANLQSNDVSILLGRGSGGVGDGTFNGPVHYFAGPRPFNVVAADFNGDGIKDLAVSNNDVHAISVLRGLGSGGMGNGAFAAPVSFPLSDRPTGMEKGDFNEDGIVDLVVAEYFSQTVAILLGQGSGGVGNGNFAPAAHYNAGQLPYAFAIADYNEDGISDLAVANNGTGGVGVLLGNGSMGVGNGTFSAPSFYALGSNVQGITTADFDEDGISDLALAIYNGDNLTILKGQGSGGVGNGSFVTHSTYPAGGFPYRPVPADLNQDGKLDIVLANVTQDQVAVFLGTCEAAPPDPRKPTITSVRDVPNDQGGKVFVTWTRSSLDVSGGPVNAYRVWRRVPPGAALVAQSDASDFRATTHTTSEGTTGTVYWEALATLPAQRLDGYGYTAATTQDSMRHSNPYTAFFVSALTYDIDVFYDSAVDSGYSVDNIRPRRPRGLAGQPVASGFALHWEPNEEPDLSGYHVYRGSTEDFTPSEENLIGTSNETDWVDVAEHGDQYYKLSAVDTHGNESEVEALAPSVPTGVGGPVEMGLALHGARPNPSLDGKLRVFFALQSGVGADLEVIDLAGRKVESRRLVGWGAGEVTLGEGRRFAPGIYLVRLRQGGQSRELKVVVAQ